MSAPRNVRPPTLHAQIAVITTPRPVYLPEGRIKDSGSASVLPGVHELLESIRAAAGLGAAVREPVRWLAGERGWLHAELDNRWRYDLSKPVVEIEKFVRTGPGREPVIVTRRTQRAATPSRDVVTEQAKPVSQADALDLLMMTYPIELPQEELDRDHVVAFDMDSLKDRQMEIMTANPGKMVVMHDGYARRQEMFSRGSNRAPQRTVFVFSPARDGKHIIRQEIWERDEGREAHNPRTRLPRQTVIRRERLPREFLDVFLGRAKPGFASEWNQEIREGSDAATGGPHAGPVPIFKDDTEPGSDTESDAEWDTSSEPAALGRQSPRPAASESDVAAVDDRLVAYGGSGMSNAELADLLNPLDFLKMQIFKAGPGQVVAVAGMFGPQPTLHMLRLVPDADPAQVVVRTARVLGYHDTETRPEKTIPLSAFDAGIQRDLRAQSAQEAGGFKREWLVGPNPEKLKDQFFMVAKGHKAHKPGRCVVLDNEHSFKVDSHGREQQKFTLSRDGAHIEVKIRNEKRASIADLRRGSTVVEHYVLPTHLFHEDLVALLKGEEGSADKWNAEVASLLKDWEERHDNA